MPPAVLPGGRSQDRRSTPPPQSRCSRVRNRPALGTRLGVAVCSTRPAVPTSFRCDFASGVLLSPWVSYGTCPFYAPSSNSSNNNSAAACELFLT